MKNFLGIPLVFMAISGYACDGCNIFTPSGFNNSLHKMGVFARQRSSFGEFSQLGEMVTKHSGHANDINIWGRQVLERYQTYEMRGDFFIKERWQLTFVVPVTNNSQFLDLEKRFSIQGLSDPTVLAGYNFIRTTKRDLSHRLGFGLGARFPVGLINIEKNGAKPDLDFQPGTGAYSFLTYLNYFLTNNKWSGFFAFNYKKSGFNSLNYQYGQIFNIKCDAFWQTIVGKNTLMLQVGAYVETAGLDQSTVRHEDTGGVILFGTTGFRFLISDLIVQGEFQPVIMQQLNGNTQLLTKNRINVGLTYVLPTKNKI